VETYITAIPRLERVITRLVALGEQGRITAAVQFTDKGGGYEVASIISVTDLIYRKV
jgi:hypothetical protein